MIDYTKITRAQAMKRVTNYEPVALTTSKCHPEGILGACHLDDKVVASEFAQLIKEFKYYNCNQEVGNGVSFWSYEA